MSELDKATIHEIDTTRCRIDCRRITIVEELRALKADLEFLALNLEGYKQRHKRNFVESLANELEEPAAALSTEIKIVSSLAKMPVNKTFMVVNGILPAPPVKTPKKAKPASPLLKIGGLQADILLALERGVSREERELMKDLVKGLIKKL